MISTVLEGLDFPSPWSLAGRTDWRAASRRWRWPRANTAISRVPDWDRVVFTAYRELGTWSPDSRGADCAAARRRRAARSSTSARTSGSWRFRSWRAAARAAIAFEPEPRNQRWLASNVARHGLAERIELHALALDAREGALELALSEDNSGDHRLLADAGAGSRDPSARVRVQARAARRRARGPHAGAPVRDEARHAGRGGARAARRRREPGAGRRADRRVLPVRPARRAATAPRRCRRCSRSIRVRDGARPTRALGRGSSRSRSCFAALGWVATDGSDRGFFDLLLARDELRLG